MDTQSVSGHRRGEAITVLSEKQTQEVIFFSWKQKVREKTEPEKQRKQRQRNAAIVSRWMRGKGGQTNTTERKLSWEWERSGERAVEEQEELETINMLIMFPPFIENPSLLHKADIEAALTLNSYKQWLTKCKKKKKEDNNTYNLIEIFKKWLYCIIFH